MFDVVTQNEVDEKYFARDGFTAEAAESKTLRGSKWMSADRGSGDILRPMRQRGQSRVAKAEAVLVLLAVVFFLAGTVRYVRLGSFTLVQAGYCLLSIPLALLLLLIFDYTVHHARIAAVIVVIFAGMLLVASPSFCVGLGVGLAGMVVARGRGA
jgi:hypothetical protein